METRLRGLADFMERHQAEGAEYFGLRKATLPRCSTLQDMVEHVAALEVAEVSLRFSFA
ncbi:MAG: hypothetical protein IGR76_17525 [Synechococcales cyanobacterium T60_A2020_003]|nr:hypothetical protein [Synechococcales cyanobacterium T60_A2020_003]